MLKKRMIFTLLVSDGSFMLSRRYRLQAIGDLQWMKQNDALASLLSSVDELVVLDVSRNAPDRTVFRSVVSDLAGICFIPISAGGWIRSVDDADLLLRSGADKVVVNTPLFTDAPLVRGLADSFGRQRVVASVDLALGPDGEWRVRTDAGRRAIDGSARDRLAEVANLPIADLYLNSIDRDGTGEGYDLTVLDHLPAGFGGSVIVAGGAGKAAHLRAALADDRVDAVATANLLDFAGDGLARARASLVDSGVDLPVRTENVFHYLVP